MDLNCVNVEASDVDSEESAQRAAIVLSGHPHDDERDGSDDDDDVEEADEDKVEDAGEEES